MLDELSQIKAIILHQFQEDSEKNAKLREAIQKLDMCIEMCEKGKEGEVKPIFREVLLLLDGLW